MPVDHSVICKNQSISDIFQRRLSVHCIDRVGKAAANLKYPKQI